MEHDNSRQQHEALFERLDAVLQDPYVTEVLQHARVYNDQLRSQLNISDEEKAGIVRDLDVLWGNLDGASAQLSGHVRWNAEAQPCYVDEVSVISKGFDILDTPLYVDGELVGMQSRVGLYMLVPIDECVKVGVSRDAYNEAVTHIGAIGDIEDVVLDFEYVASPEYIQTWLSEFYPELLHEIDRRILSVDGSEADAIMTLQDFDFESSDTVSEKAQGYLDIYLDEMIQPDQDIPYSANIDGSAYATLSDGTMQACMVHTDGSLVKISRVHIRTIEDDPLRAYVSATVFGSKRTVGGQKLLIPVDSFISLTSVRSAFYESMPTD